MCKTDPNSAKKLGRGLEDVKKDLKDVVNDVKDVAALAEWLKHVLALLLMCVPYASWQHHQLVSFPNLPQLFRLF
jgi:hypothetical protein